MGSICRCSHLKKRHSGKYTTTKCCDVNGCICPKFVSEYQGADLKEGKK